MEMIRWDILAEIGDELEGTCNGLESIIERYGFDVSEDALESMLADPQINIERCPGCGWWWSCGEMDDEGYCPDCHSQQGDDFDGKE